MLLNSGSIDIGLNLGATVADQSCLASHPATLGAGANWLRSQFGSCAASYDRDPSARATFGIFPFGQFEEMGKQNMALFEQALKMLSPYGRDGKEPADTPPPSSGGRDAPEPEDPRLRRLEAQIEALREQLDALGRNPNKG